jgi:hypothetical protein
MTDNRTGVPLITDILDVLDRHGYTRGDTAHTARAILLISDLANIYEGSQDHPFGPHIGKPPSGTEPAPPGPADWDVVLSASELNTVVAALDDARLYKRDRVATCTDCIDMSCGNCQGRLQAAHTYATLASLLAETAQAARATAASHPGPASQPQADREAGE